MLEIKGISVKLKKANDYLIKDISLYVKDGRLVPKTRLSDLEKEVLFSYANNQRDYEVKIGKVLFNGEDIKEIADTQKKTKLMSTVKQIQEKKSNSVSNFICKQSLSRENQEIIKETIDPARSLTSITITMQLLSWDVFWGSLLAIPTGLMVMKKARPENNTPAQS